MSERLRPRPPRKTGWIFAGVLLALYLPLACVVAGSFLDFDRAWTLRWWSELATDSRLAGALGISLQIASASSVAATVLGTLATLALYRGVFRGQNFLRGLNYVSLAVPEIVFALALLSWFFLLQLTLGRFSVFLAHVTFSVSYVVMTVSARMESLDRSLDDAASDLGAGAWQRFRWVHLPLLRPAILNAGLLSFLLSFDDFLITFFVAGATSQTLPVVMYTSLKTGFSPKLNALAAALWIVTALVLILSLRLSRAGGGHVQK